MCLHGLASNARWWDLVGLRLAPRHHVVAPDLRGHGASDRPADGYGFQEIGSDLVELMGSLGLRDVVLVGHSWGASVALWLGVHAPELVAGLVLVDGGVVSMRRIFGATWSEAERAMTPPGFPQVPPSELRTLVARSGLAEGSDAATAAAILLGNLEPGPDGFLRPRLDRRRHLLIARALWELDGGRLLEAARQPVLIVPALGAGASGRQVERDRSVRDARAVLGARGAVRWVEGGHDLPVLRPDAVAAAIGELAASLGNGPPAEAGGPPPADR